MNGLLNANAHARTRTNAHTRTHAHAHMHAGEYPLYVKGLILRSRGKIQESLTLFSSATCLNPHNTANLKQASVT